MNCSNAKKELPLLAHDELESAKRDALKQHLNGCTACQSLAKQYGYLAEQVRKLPAPQESEGFYDTFFQEIMERVSKNEQRVAPEWQSKIGLGWLALKPRMAFAGVGALLVLVLSFFLSNHFYFSSKKQRTTLEAYLERSDYRGLARAMQNTKQQEKLLNDLVPVRLFIDGLRKLERLPFSQGFLARLLTESVANTLVGRPQRRSQVFRDYFKNESLDFKAVLKALSKIDRPGARVSVQELIKWKRGSA
ncbi:MAG: anti-sigma factor family protein [bacterium]